MFIQLNEKNEIIVSANFKFAEDAIETDKEIVRNWDGRLVFKGEETEKPEPSLEELKANKKAELKQKRDKYKSENGFSQFVYENLEFGLIEDIDNEKAKWRAFLQDLIKQYDDYRNQINLAQSKEELDNINIVFSNNRESYYE